ncbi:MAG: phytoene desaturase family protein [Candidatus Promineifilaceae bacterium]
MAEYDAVVAGAGPNGLAAAIRLAEAGCKVVVFEGEATIGGGTRTAELTLPGFKHDLCSAIHPLLLASPFMRSQPLAELGLELLQPEVALAHPFDDGTAAALLPSLEATAETLAEDGPAYAALMQPWVGRWQALVADFLGPLRWPRRPLLFLRFGLQALQPAALLARRRFRGPAARALFAGVAAHSILPLTYLDTSGWMLLAILGHAVGWPVARGGSQHIAQALAGRLAQLGGEIVTGTPVRSLAQLPPARARLLDVAPRSLLAIAGEGLPAGYRRQLERYRYGPGVFKVDWALDGPIPWRAEVCGRAGTVHLGGTLAEIAAGERAVWDGRPAERPFVILAQQSLVDRSRAPAGKHTAWAYCHVPNGSTADMSAAITAQVERFAPGFSRLVLATHTCTAAEMEAYNPNYVGGDINTGAQHLLQHFSRPALRLNPYAAPAEGLYLCSSATPPGGGVHGMCGYHAAQAALRRMA